MKHKSKEFIINTPFVTSWRVVSPRLARCHLGASDKIVELNQGICKGKEIAYFVKIYPSEASPSWVMAMVGDTSILHHAFILIFIALWAVITHYVTILMAILSYFTRFIMKRENAGSWNSGLEKEQILETYSAQLQKS